MRILITGAAGFIGSHLAERLVAGGDVVVGLDNFDGFYPRADKERNLAALARAPRFTLIEGDVRAAADLDRAFAAAGGADVVVHLAALAGVRPSLREPARYYDVNVVGTARLFEACLRAKVGRLVFASSSSVYGTDSRPPFAEHEICQSPVSPYAASKRAGELMCHAAHVAHGWAVTCLRFFTVYGPRQRRDLAIAKFAERMSRDEPIELYGDGRSARDYTYVDDIVAGVQAAIAQLLPLGPIEPRHRVYNLCSGRAIELAELVARLSAALGKPAQVIHRPEQPGDLPMTLGDLGRSRRELGWRPRVSLDEGLARFVAWWRARTPRPSPPPPILPQLLGWLRR